MLAVPLWSTISAPVNRARLARYLELPSVAQIDPVTDAEIAGLDARRDELLSPWQRAVCLPIGQVHGRWVELDGDASPIEATDAYGRQLLDSEADALVLTAFTIGARVDELIKRHLDREEVYEAFVLKQWAATMTEQARVDLTRGLRNWAQRRGRALLPHDGPGYNGWPLTSLGPLLEMIHASGEPHAQRPIRATDCGVLLPTNSMVIVYGVTCTATGSAGHEERLAQCHRCAMRNCRYRLAAHAELTS